MDIERGKLVLIFLPGFLYQRKPVSIGILNYKRQYLQKLVVSPFHYVIAIDEPAHEIIVLNRFLSGGLFQACDGIIK